MTLLPAHQRLLLMAAVLVPVVYFGAQAVAAPYFPNYSMFTTTASALGSDLSARPGILNTGAFLTGVLAFLGALGFCVALPRLGTGRVAACVLAACLFSGGLASIWASLHPLPHPQHNPGALGLGMFAMPFAAPWAAWRLPVGWAVRGLLVAKTLVFIGLGVVMSGSAGVDLSALGGLFQKLIAASAWGAGAAVALAALVCERRGGRAL